jgi:putative SOS response-associated peptidase YedK
MSPHGDLPHQVFGQDSPSRLVENLKGTFVTHVISFRWMTKLTVIAPAKVAPLARRHLPNPSTSESHLRPLSIRTPVLIEPIFEALWESNALKTRAQLTIDWPSYKSIQPGGRLPVLRLKNGTVVCEAAPFGWRPQDRERQTMIVEAEGRGFARRCIVLAAWVDVEEDGSNYRVSHASADNLCLGAIWRPANQYGFEPSTLALMTTSPPVDCNGTVRRGLIHIPAGHELAWLDGQRDTMPLQGPARAGVFKIERLAATEPIKAPQVSDVN